MLTTGERRTHVRYFLAFWLFVLSAVAYLDRTNISIAGLQISRDYGLGNQHLGWILSSFLIGYALFQIPAGYLAARFGPRRVMAIGVLCQASAAMLTAVLPTHFPGALFMLISIRCFLGVGESVIYPAANQFVANWIPLQERGFINGLIFAGVGVGSALTPPLLIWIIVSHGWRAAFAVSGVVDLCAGAVWWFSSRDIPEEHPAVSRSELNVIRDGITFPSSSAAARPTGTTNKIAWRAIFTSRDLAALMIGYFSFGYISWVYFGWFFQYLVQVRGLDLKSSAFYTQFPFICMTVCCLLGGWLSDRLTKRFSLRVGRCALASFSMFLTAPLLFLGSHIHEIRLAVFLLAAAAGSLYLAQSSFWSVSVDIAGKSSGVFSSIVNMSCQIGGALTASLTPWLAHKFSWTTSFNVVAALAVLGALSWLIVHPERRLDE